MLLNFEEEKRLLQIYLLYHLLICKLIFLLALDMILR